MPITKIARKSTRPARPAARKLDLRTKLQQLYKASATLPSIVEVPPLDFLMIDGAGEPARSASFQEAIGALYALAYTLKFTLKRLQAADYAVMPLEGLWWTANGRSFSADHADEWRWTLMIGQPEPVTPQLLAAAQAEALRKKPLPALRRVRLERLQEGLCAQILHVGPYAAEQATIAKLHAFVEAQGFRPRGKHHEIYLGDPRRAAPERLKTILRHPIERIAAP